MRSTTAVPLTHAGSRSQDAVNRGTGRDGDRTTRHSSATEASTRVPGTERAENVAETAGIVAVRCVIIAQSVLRPTVRARRSPKRGGRPDENVRRPAVRARRPTKSGRRFAEKAGRPAERSANLGKSLGRFTNIRRRSTVRGRRLAVCGEEMTARARRCEKRRRRLFVGVRRHASNARHVQIRGHRSASNGGRFGEFARRHARSVLRRGQLHPTLSTKLVARSMS